MRSIKDALLDAAGLPKDAEIPKVDLSAANGRPPAPQPESDKVRCHICGDAGFVRRNVPLGHPDFGKPFPCVCNQPEPEHIIQLLITLSRLPTPSRQTHRFETWQSSPSTDPVLQAAHRYTEGQVAHPFLTFAGPPGTGKTHLALSIGWDWLEQRRGTVIYWRVASLLDALRAGYDRENRSATPDTYLTLHAVTHCDLLILDDLGAERDTEWATEKLDQIVDERYIARRRLVVTTNATPNELPPRLESRLRHGAVYVIDAPDYRRRQERRRQP